ncbi:3596_t:CDS:2 [Racocetra fulgida]|uniref:3596_t:CDS:1 n=1 Tax=Racocetra fulgida TaxID=60492 RepID=A0A9N8ZPZ4_9GLOM|nr:3596_t:CDS:2 [Racocetra fulgida]
MDSQNTAIAIINYNVDLTKLNESWTVSVNPGNYKLYMMDRASYNYTLSDVFTISNNNQTRFSNSNNNQPSSSAPNNPPSSSSIEGVTFDAPLNVSMGSNIAITWSYSGTQSKLAVLGIMNSQNSNIQIIDSNVDLTKKSQPWAVTVGAGMPNKLSPSDEIK